METRDQNISREDLQSFSKEELIERVISMQSHVKQLKNIIKKRNVCTSAEVPKSKSGRNFDVRKYKRRHIALKLLYLGWDYNGFTEQEDTQQTIESALFDALIRTRLIESRQTSNYHRCGRTDKGVSAFSQVISIDVRTNMKSGKGVITPEDYIESEDNEKTEEENRQEINYSLILNSVLPENIRIICWSPVESEFSARFDCKTRTYKYFFPKADLDIESMRIACNYLLGEHDFRNFCKMDIGNGVTNYKRNVLFADLVQYCTQKDSADNSLDESYSMCCLTITGRAFLWHQIRCIVALLFLIGQQKEEPIIISELLDIEKHPNKPQYCMSADFPLVLFETTYSQTDINQWIYDSKALKKLIRHLQCLWTKQVVKTEIIKSMVTYLTIQMKCNIGSEEVSTLCSQIEPLCMGAKYKNYTPLFERPFGDTLEQRLSKSNKKAKT